MPVGRAAGIDIKGAANASLLSQVQEDALGQWRTTDVPQTNEEHTCCLVLIHLCIVGFVTAGATVETFRSHRIGTS